MYIPKSMKNNIANTFYDKQIFVYNSTPLTDEEGGVISVPTTISGSFKGNLSFSNCKKIQEDYGLDYDIDVSITTDYSLLTHDSLIQYEDIVYSVTDILKSDSHFLILATKTRNNPVVSSV